MTKNPPTIKRIKLCNFKRFRCLDIEPNDKLNLIVGANESGKSSLLSAIHYVVNASRHQIESVGIDTLINQSAVNEFLTGYTGKKSQLSDLPRTFVELYLEDQNNPNLNGKNNSTNKDYDGLKLVIEPDEDFHEEIKDGLSGNNPDFPYDYYKISFTTFAGRSYLRRNEYVSGILVDQSSGSDTIAAGRFVRDLYNSSVDDKTRAINRASYRQTRNQFAKEKLKSIKTGGQNSFAIKTSSKDNLETSLTIRDEESIDLGDKGKGEQALIKIGSALGELQGVAMNNLSVVMIEEPENHLSHSKMKQLIENISKHTGNEKQLFITTHNSLIASGLDLSKCIVLGPDQNKEPLTLGSLGSETAKFFMKAPNSNMLEMVLSPKVILVEGASEYILMGKLFETVSGGTPQEKGVHIISVGGITFKRYLEVAKITEIKVAVITDNDGDPNKNCRDKYAKYEDLERIKISYSQDAEIKTFEEAIYKDNKGICDTIFASGKRDIQKYMLGNKTESAHKLANEGKDIVVPEYIREAIEWVTK